MINKKKMISVGELDCVKEEDIICKNCVYYYDSWCYRFPPSDIVKGSDDFCGEFVFDG